MTKLFYLILLVSTNIFLAGGYLTAQELEPRALTNIPKGMNFVAAGYAYTSGNTLLDPAINIEDLNARIHSTVFAWVRSVNFFGKSGKVDVVIPVGFSDFKGVFEGEPFHDISNGLGDIRLRGAINLTGAPALPAAEFPTYQQKTVTGLSMQVHLPTGAYRSEQIANLGTNRVTIRLNYGVSHTFEKWVAEIYGGVWFFGDNKDFLGGNKLSQSSLWVIKSHLVRTFSRGKWLAIDAGYGYGGQTYVNGEKRDAIISALRFGLTFAIPLYKKHSLKFTAGTGIRFKQGPDFDIIGIVYQYNWLKQ